MTEGGQRCRKLSNCLVCDSNLLFVFGLDAVMSVTVLFGSPQPTSAFFAPIDYIALLVKEHRPQHH